MCTVKLIQVAQMPEETNIVELIRKGDKNAYESIFKNHYSHLCAYANTFLGNTDAAEDIVQDVFFQIWQKREQLNIEGSVKGYLFKSVHNSCLNALKHKKVKEAHKVHTMYEFKDSADLPLHEKESDGLHETLRKAIEKLPPERKKIFIMHRFEELKYKEIAENLNLSVKTVENQIGKALGFLREEVRKYVPLGLLIILSEWIKKFLN